VPGRTHFRPFTRVLSEIRSEVTLKVVETTDFADFTDWEYGGRRVGCFELEQASTPAVTTSYFSATGCSRLLFLAQFLKSGIGAQRVPDRIEPNKGRRNGPWINPAIVGRL